MSIKSNYLEAEPNLIKLRSPILVVGDIHGYLFVNSGNFMTFLIFSKNMEILLINSFFSWEIMLIEGLLALKSLHCCLHTKQNILDSFIF